MRKVGSGAVASFPPQPDFYTNEDWTEGVSTFDLVLISKHILGITPLPDGYKIIAADANKSNSVTTFDILQLRKLILGIIPTLPPFDEPWRFVPEYIPQDYQSTFDVNPFSMTIGGMNVSANQYLDAAWTYQILDGQGDKAGYDGIKIGDVDGNYLEDSPVPGCDDQEPTLAVPQELMETDAHYELLVKANNFEDIIAFQLGLEADAEMLEIEEVLPADMTGVIGEETYHIAASEKGSGLRIAWYQEDSGSASLATGQGLFKVKVKALQPITHPAEAFTLADEVLENAFYLESGCKVAVALEIEIIPESGHRSNGSGPGGAISAMNVDKLICHPNPIDNSLRVHFSSAQIGNGTIEIHDAQARLLLSLPIAVEQGVNSFELKDLESIPAGVLNVAVRIPSGRLISKVVKI